jgi:hypothetical protein
MATRELMPINEDMATLDPTEFLKAQTENIQFGDEDASKHRHVIPALVPPLRLKPIL